MEIPSSSTVYATLGSSSATARERVRKPNPVRTRKVHRMCFNRRTQDLLNRLGTYQAAFFCLHRNKWIVTGTEPLRSVLYSFKNIITANVMDKLHQSNIKGEMNINGKAAKFYLPKLIFNGRPNALGTLSLRQMQQFIPLMLRYSTGRLRPFYGNPKTKPVWWPKDLPWHIRFDLRTDAQKLVEPFDHCLRRIIWSCYMHHQRTDLLCVAADYRKETELMKSAFDTRRDIEKEILVPSQANTETLSLVMSVDGNVEMYDSEMWRQIAMLLGPEDKNADNSVTLYAAEKEDGDVIDGRLHCTDKDPPKESIGVDLWCMYCWSCGKKPTEASVCEANCKKNANACNLPCN